MTKKGFTLIELLVVISIIGILIGLSLIGLQGARESSRDSRRKADLETIRSGIEIYKSDCNQYPGSLGSTLIGDDSSLSCARANTYIEEIPKDPVSGEDYVYTPAQAGTTYQKYEICAKLEQNPTTPQRCLGNCPTCNYRVVNP